MSNQFLRYEVNQMAKAVLTRHAVNLSTLHFSFSGATLYLYGSLKRDPDGDFSTSTLEPLLSDLAELPQVKHLEFDLEDWNIYSDMSSWKISPRKRPAVSYSDTDKTYVIEKDETVKEILDDLKAERHGTEEKKRR